METIYFVLGMLSIIYAGIISAMVWGIVKINKTMNRLNSFELQLIEASRNSQLDNANIVRELDNRESAIYRRIEEDGAYIHRRIDESLSYTDSRIDTMLNKLGNSVTKEKKDKEKVNDKPTILKD